MRDLARISERFKSINLVPYRTDLRDQLETLAVEMHAQSAFSQLELDVNKSLRHWETADRSGAYFRIAERGGTVFGAVYGFVATTFFSHDLFGHVKGIWVLKEHQGSAAFVRLLTDFEQHAKAMGARFVFLDQTTALDIERSMNLFEGCGYRLIGVNTVKEL